MCADRDICMQIGSVSGVLTFLIAMVRSGTESRFKKHLVLLKAKDVQAAGGLALGPFTQLCAVHFPEYQACVL